MKKARDRLRHPIGAIREPFGKAGLTVAIFALVMALVGGAYAAGGLTKSQEKQVTKIAKKYAGKPGANGTGGSPGTVGKDGTNGSPGAPGTSATAESFAGSKGPIGGVTCTEGGLLVKSASGETLVCNGKKGASGINGSPGSPWTPDSQLPEGATETGEWTNPVLNIEGLHFASISFPVQLKEPLDESHVHIIGAGATHTTGAGDLEAGSRFVKNLSTATGHFVVGEAISGAGIPAGTFILRKLSDEELILSQDASGAGTAVSLTADLPVECEGSVAEPTATSGNLCVYSSAASPENIVRAADFELGADTAGALLELGEQHGTASGTWAVTG
jgi:hypothetical protein